MTGVTHLGELLRGLSPALDATEYLFVSLSRERAEALRQHAWMWCNEDEGVTLILPADISELPDDLSRKDRFCRITLKVHSSLHAVGLTAAVSKVLADVMVPANMVAGFYHDHLFVPASKATRAIEALERIAADT